MGCGFQRGVRMTTSILLADSYVLFRDAVRSLIETRGDCSVVAEASDGPETIDLIEKHAPDLVITESSLPRLSGVEVTRRCIRNGSRSRFLFLSTHDGRRHVEQAFHAGAAGYVCKGDPATELLRAIDAVRGERTYLSPTVAAHLVDVVIGRNGSPESDDADLTSREREVLQLVAEGMSSKEIASSLGVSTRTVESHRSNLMDKLGIHKVSGLVRYAIREGLLSP